MASQEKTKTTKPRPKKRVNFILMFRSARQFTQEFVTNHFPDVIEVYAGIDNRGLQRVFVQSLHKKRDTQWVKDINAYNEQVQQQTLKIVLGGGIYPVEESIIAPPGLNTRLSNDYKYIQEKCASHYEWKKTSTDEDLQQLMRLQLLDENTSSEDEEQVSSSEAPSAHIQAQKKNEA